MLKRSIVVMAASAALSVMVAPAPLVANDADIFVPAKPVAPAPAKPASPAKPITPADTGGPRNPMIGSWLSIGKGGVQCGSGTITIEAGDRGIWGHASFGNGRYDGDFTSVDVRAGQVHFSYKYTDTFGNAAVTVYDGMLSADGNTVTGSNAAGTWGAGCTFELRRQ